MEIATIEELVSENHLLRKINQYLDFSCIPEKVRPRYSEDNGIPSLGPHVLFKMMFIGYFYGIRSERDLQ
ncbi:transposase [Halobacillus kuroshimensis]|uniref:Transposase n=1 Tax=Halobacillus kuroshimensis TaxID=302481 RepID=A0ABS3DS83_9BACI|nr:transposase [Halobacillus kuroshimensis]